MTDAGINELGDKLEAIQKKTNHSLSFLDIDVNEDLLQHIYALTLRLKGSVNNVFQKNGKLITYPCITKVFSVIPKITKGTFPKETARDPVTCAKIQYVLYNNYANKTVVKQVEQDIMQCKCTCETCYRLAFDEYFRYGTLQCKK